MISFFSQGDDSYRVLNMGHRIDQSSPGIPRDDRPTNALRVLSVARLGEQEHRPKQQHDQHNHTHPETRGADHHRRLSHNCRSGGRRRSAPTTPTTTDRANSDRSCNAVRTSPLYIDIAFPSDYNNVESPINQLSNMIETKYKVILTNRRNDSRTWSRHGGLCRLFAFRLARHRYQRTRY